MFLHTPTFKKLLKASWKNGGITVGRLDSLSLFVAGDYWVTWFDYTSIPNRIRAAIIEYAGELPERIDQRLHRSRITGPVPHTGNSFRTNRADRCRFRR